MNRAAFTYLYCATPAQQGAYAEMVSHPELKNVRIQAADLDYALRENAACWGGKP